MVILDQRVSLQIPDTPPYFFQILAEGEVFVVIPSDMKLNKQIDDWFQVWFFKEIISAQIFYLLFFFSGILLELIVSGVEADMWPKYHQRIKAAFGENVEDLDVEVEAGKSFWINHNCLFNWHWETGSKDPLMIKRKIICSSNILPNMMSATVTLSA